ncbi:MAG: preprotein translocase subunit YajC [Acutalibacteraceae bacterium]
MNSILLAASTASSTGEGGSLWTMLIIYAVIFLALYFLIIRPRSQKSKKEAELRNSIEIGDDVTTIGGIVGKVVAVRDEDDEIIIETGADRVKMRMKKWSISTVDTQKEKPLEKTEEKKGFSFFKKKDKTDDTSKPETSVEK